MEQELVPAAGFELRTIERVPFPRRPNMAALKFFFRFRKAVKQAGEILAQVQADTVVGFGGYVSTPVYAAAKNGI
ncbi:glycosyltransferase [Arcanobacterium hippocoleae]